MDTVTAIWMPPYYAELYSNELICAMLKGKEARSNLAFKNDTTLPVTVTVVQLMTKEQTQRVRDMKRLEISLLC